MPGGTSQNTATIRNIVNTKYPRYIKDFDYGYFL